MIVKNQSKKKVFVKRKKNIAQNKKKDYGHGSDLELGMNIRFDVFCETEKIQITLQCPANKWCGIVFNQYMQGDTIVYYNGNDGNSLYDMHFPSRQQLYAIL